MTGHHISLSLAAESTEGIHDFIAMLEHIAEEMKGGYESGSDQTFDGEHPSLTYQWAINTHEHEHGN